MTPAFERTSNNNPRKRRTGCLPWGITLILTVYLSGFLITKFAKKDLNSNFDDDLNNLKIFRHKRDTSFTQIIYSQNETFNATTVPPQTTTGKKNGIYPPDVFDREKRRNGAVVIHVFGMLYMFAALAIVCDEFFVPALEVITFRLSISDDVAGATFMAAGGSAPELFTSIIGVFLAQSNVGVGTIVGSAVFNILFVIGMCGLLSHEVLQLTWWPLFRDCSFYIISLVFLIYSFLDAEVQYYESIVLILIYLSYVTFMKFNRKIERSVKSKLRRLSTRSDIRAKNKISPSVRAIVESISNPAAFDTKHPKNTFSFGIVQLIMHSLDPAPEEMEEHEEKSYQLYAIARGKYASKLGTRENGIVEHNEATTPSATTVIFENEGVKIVPQDNTRDDTQMNTACEINGDQKQNGNGSTTMEENGLTDSQKINGNCVQDKQLSGEGEEAMGEALDMSWPHTRAKQCVYLFIFPIMFLLSITLPDVRIPAKEKWFMVSFFGSIFWIAIFSYIMVWMASQIGDTIGITDTIMGLTFLAAGTSVPDLITSVIVARKGLGDMAVSSSVGSNIFDVTIGLPFPWLLKSIIYLGQAIEVDSAGLLCLVLLLFGMLLFVVISIAVCRWKMNKRLGLTMLVLYVVFLVLAILLELQIIGCPNLT